MLLRKILSRAGFSMTEIMVAMGLMGGISLVGMKLMEETSTNESYLRFRSEVAKATSIIQNNLNDKNNCRSLLVGKTRGAFGAGVSLSQLNTNSIVLLRENTDYDGFRIPSGGIKLEASPRNTATLTVTDVVLTFEIRRRAFSQRKAGNNDLITKRISVQTEMNGSTIRSCGPVLADANADSKKQLCDSLGTKVAVWNTTTQECNLLKFACPYGQVPSQLTSLGAYGCVPVERQLNPDTLFDWSTDACSGSGAQIRLTTGVDGKIKVECL